jgi:hypothetical protein
MTDNFLAPRPPSPHPTPEQLYRARRGPRTSEAERWLAHAAACAACSEELLHQEAFDAPEPVAPSRLAAAWERSRKRRQAPPAPLAPVIPISRPLHQIASIAQPPPSRPRLSRSGRAGLGLAAALVTAVVGMTGLGLWNHAPAPQPGPLRGAAEPSGTWQPSGLLEAPPAEILFPAPLDGEPRRVKVYDTSRSYSWTSPPAAGGRIAFPEAERKKLRPGVSYFWTVLDDLDGENAAARSFRLRSKR